MLYRCRCCQKVALFLHIYPLKPVSVPADWGLWSQWFYLHLSPYDGGWFLRKPWEKMKTKTKRWSIIIILKPIKNSVKSGLELKSFFTTLNTICASCWSSNLEHRNRFESYLMSQVKQTLSLNSEWCEKTCCVREYCQRNVKCMLLFNVTWRVCDDDNFQKKRKNCSSTLHKQEVIIASRCADIKTSFSLWTCVTNWRLHLKRVLKDGPGCFLSCFLYVVPWETVWHTFCFISVNISRLKPLTADL